MRITLLIPIWKRPRLTRLVLSYYARLARTLRYGSQIELDVLVVYSDDGYFSEHMETVGFNDHIQATTRHNNPLSAKCQHGLSVVQVMQPDAVVICGSDDLLPTSYFRYVARLVQDGIGYVRLAHCYFYDVQSRTLSLAKHVHPGAGTCISRRVLDELGWTLWPGERDHHLDMLMFRQLESVHCQHVKIRGGAALSGHFVLDIKTGSNVWDIEGSTLLCSTTGTRLAIRGMRSVEAEPFLRQHFPHEADQLLNWQSKEQVL